MTKPSQNAPRLKSGEHIRLTEGGPVYEVTRVTDGGAHIRSIRHLMVQIGDRSFEAEEGTVLVISAHAFVYRTRDH